MASIFAYIPDDVSVLKIEVILNPLLCKEFHRFAKDVTREVVFHGTNAANVESIVENGLWTDVKIANGRAYGDGVYVSKNPKISRGYACTEGYIFVCAAVNVNWHVGQDIGTVQNNDMLLPCYLLRVQQDGKRVHSKIKATSSGFLYADKSGDSKNEVCGEEVL
jgi:hypothetical protein